jgi:hypothetical protein
VISYEANACEGKDHHGPEDGGRELEIRSDEKTSIIANFSIRERQRRFTATI